MPVCRDRTETFVAGYLGHITSSLVSMVKPSWSRALVGVLEYTTLQKHRIPLLLCKPHSKKNNKKKLMEF